MLSDNGYFLDIGGERAQGQEMDSIKQALDLIPQWQWGTMPWLIIAAFFAMRFGDSDT